MREEEKMKRWLLVISVLVLLASFVYSQEQAQTTQPPASATPVTEEEAMSKEQAAKLLVQYYINKHAIPVKDMNPTSVTEQENAWIVEYKYEKEPGSWEVYVFELDKKNGEVHQLIPEPEETEPVKQEVGE